MSFSKLIVSEVENLSEEKKAQTLEFLEFLQNGDQKNVDSIMDNIIDYNEAEDSDAFLSSFDDQTSGMEKIHYLAADIYGYSYDNYQEKVEMGHVRFTKYMPNDIRQLRKGIKNNWHDVKLAKVLEIDLDQVKDWKKAYIRSKELLESRDAGVHFKTALGYDLQKTLKGDLSKEELEKLVEVISYTLADFGHLLKEEGKELSDYSDYLRYGDF